MHTRFSTQLIFVIGLAALALLVAALPVQARFAPGGVELRPLVEPDETEPDSVLGVSNAALNPQLAARTSSQVQLYRLPDLTSAMGGALDPGTAVYIWGFTKDGQLAGLTDQSSGMLLGWVTTDLLIFNDYKTEIAREIDLFSRPNPRSKTLGKLAAEQSIVVLGADARGEWLAINTLQAAQHIVGWIPAGFAEQAPQAREMTKR